MKKINMIPFSAGKNTRMTFFKSETAAKLAKKNKNSSNDKREKVLEMPYLIGIQRDSYIWFLNEGLNEAFNDIFPISDNDDQYGEDKASLTLEYLGLRLCTEECKLTIPQCKERDATYSAPLKIKLRLHKHLENYSMEDEVYMGELPLMTESGSFVYNGSERVVVSQMVRSPGVYFNKTTDKFGKELYNATLIPSRGAWIEYEMDANNVVWVRVDREKKVPLTVFLRALYDIDRKENRNLSKEERDRITDPIFAHGTDDDIRNIFPDERLIEKTIEKEHTSIYEKKGQKANKESAISYFYEKMRPGERLTRVQAESLLREMLFNPDRYDLAKAGRYKYNQKLHLMYRINGMTLAEDFYDMSKGKKELLFKKGTVITLDIAKTIQDTGAPFVKVEINDQSRDSDENEKRMQLVRSSMMVDISYHISSISKAEFEELGITEPVYYPVLKRILEKFGDKSLSKKDVQEELKKELKENIASLIPKHITLGDIYASINYFLCLEIANIGNIDDIDHLGNRRIRSVGELLQNEYRKGLSRMQRGVREKMNTQKNEELTIQSLVNIKPVTAVIKEFFGSSQLSQFMDQNNPLSELTHKRRLSALGPGGISRDRAGFEVRDVHYTHYGRICPIETPEGPNIGLINSLASYAKVNKYGFIQAPYRKVIIDENGQKKVTNETVYMTADSEDLYKIAQASEPLDEEGHFMNAIVSGRFKDETSLYNQGEIDFMDVSPQMVFSVATNCIPFLENDDANRALMGSNMQRQAVPLMITEEPVIGTGIESKAAVDSGICVVAKEGGEVKYVDANRIVIEGEKTGDKDEYILSKFQRSNQSNSYNQKPIVDVGQKVKMGEIIADGASTYMGELALGKNPLIGFMTWEGYNYEDAVLISERLVKDDVYTSIQIDEQYTDERETKLGAEEITRDVPQVEKELLKELDEDGVIRLGAEVRQNDILVGKITPKGETEQTAEEKLLRAIFGEKSKEVRDSSLRVPHGSYGVVIGTNTFTRPTKGKDRDTDIELPPGVRKRVRVYIAQKRKISVGDKMAGRHGNKGVVSRVLPVEDMPYLPNGRPLDIVLNPLGVPSRMNIGQVLEIHLSLAAKVLGIDIATPSFDGANEEDIQNILTVANDYVNEDWEVFKEKYGQAHGNKEAILDQEVIEYLEKNLDHRKEWKGVPITTDGKVQLRDGRTGEAFDAKTTIGFMHYLKLHHLVDDKIHSRATGPYAVVTQQPLGGKAQFGGQRFGEMEVWALEAYGAAYTLQEILTIKSDDMVGRTASFEAIVAGRVIEQPSLPESFKVLLKELQALALDVTLLDDKNREVKIPEVTSDDRKKSRNSNSYSKFDKKQSRYSSFSKEEIEEIGNMQQVDDYSGMEIITEENSSENDN